jgi:probable aminopeptidase NPEPL1
MPANVLLHARPDDVPEAGTYVALGRRHLLEPRPPRAAAVPEAAWRAMLGSGDPGDDGRLSVTFVEGSPERVAAAVLPERVSRHNTPTRALAVPALLGGLRRAGDVAIHLYLDDPAHAAALTLAVARALPAYSATSSAKAWTAHVAATGPDGAPVDLTPLAPAAEAVRAAASWVDEPPNRLDPDRFVALAREAAGRCGAALHVVRGHDLADQGLHGLWAVGKAARQAPALLVLDHDPDTHVEGAPHPAWVGKGITYDTGGLSLKAKAVMPGMKNDMGGAAAVLAAFGAAVHLGCPHRLTAVLAVAENAIGPDSTRNDDIIQMYSGRTVEVNNTDAEGRLVLADAAAWVTRHREPTQLIDLATLTGAQGIATGKHHAAIVSNDDALEAAAIDAGRAIGELVFPLPFTPELHLREFASRVADMRNSVKDRNNAQSSCAALFIHAHMKPETPWLHVDLAAPVTRQGLGTGFGVGLLLQLAGLL